MRVHLASNLVLLHLRWCLKASKLVIMPNFDIVREIKILNGDIGLPRDFDYDLNRAIENKALWAASDRFVAHIVMAILVGQRDDAIRLLPKAKHWMELAKELGQDGNRYGQDSHRFHRQLYALILWLNDGIHDSESLAFWLSSSVEYYRNQKGGPDSVSLGLSAETFLNAGGYEDFIALAAHGGIESIKCSGANEKQMALTLAAQALTQKFPEEKVQATVKKFLDKHVGKWLNNGHAVSAAEWMKVIYWKSGETGISPFDAVRKCLDHVEH